MSRRVWTPAMLEHFEAHGIDPAIATASGIREQRGRLVTPTSGATWLAGPAAPLGALLCDGENDALAAGSVLYEARRGRLRYRAELPERLYELAPVALLDPSSPARVLRDLREAGFEHIYILTREQGETSFAARLCWEAWWSGRVTIAGAIAPDRALSRALGTVPVAERPTYLAQLVRRGVVAELRRALTVVAVTEPEIVCEVFDAHPRLLAVEPESGA